jgi:hypothetical protein
MEDSAIREGRAAASGEKPLKEVVPMDAPV